MILTRKCMSITRTLPLQLLYTIKSGFPCNELLSNYTNNKLDYLSCRHCKFDVLISKEKMNNPARTSTVILENYYVQVANYFKNSSYKLVKNFSKNTKGLWVCHISVQWPSFNEFCAEESKKTEAARVASWLAIEWLKSLNKMDKDGRPLLVREQMFAMNFNVGPEALKSIIQLTQKYENEIKPLYKEYDAMYGESIPYFDDCDIPLYNNLSDIEKAERNDILLNKLKNAPPKDPLPVDKLNEQIVHFIETNRVVVIKGATGSGKTTRVPQLLLDYYIKQHKGVECNIVITQPRRISATSLATRVAAERKENLGFSIGHHVRFTTCYPTKPGTIVFISNGILLQRLLLDPMLTDLSHVIIDEAHERDVNIDLLLHLMKELLEKNDKIRVVIMSATLNAELFRHYFNNCPLLSIPGFMYNVKTYFIDDEIMSQHFRQRDYEYDERDIDDNLIIDVVQWIHCTRELGAILVFLPGWSDISKIQKVLQSNCEMVVLTAHSKMKIEQQELIFEKPPEGKRKVILATNIAESSITIPDVVYVVDSGIVREIGSCNGVKGLTNVWISKAVADQRRGRAGRVKEGECFRLYSRKKYESFDEFPVPEVLRTSLESLVMRIKTYTDDKVLNTLSKFPERPPENTVREAVTYLQQISILDKEENLTALGRRIAMFAMHPLLSAALVYSVFFNCIDPMLFTTSNLNGDASLFGIDIRGSSRRSLLTKYHPTNDLLAAYNVYSRWRSSSYGSILDSSEKEGTTNLNIKSMEIFKKVLRLNMDYLFKAHLVTVDQVMRYEENTLLSEATDFVAPIFLAVTGRLAVNTKPYFANGKVNYYLSTLDGFRVQIANDSVNFKTTQLSSPFLTFYHMNTTEEGFLRIYDTAQISPLAVLLFCPTLPQIFVGSSPDTVQVVYPNIQLQITENRCVIQSLLRLREIMWNSVQFFVTHYNSYCDESIVFKEFKSQLHHVLSDLLKNKNCDS